MRKDLQSVIDEIRALPGEWVISDPAEGVCACDAREAER